MPILGWNREYEINFSVGEGKPVVPEFSAGDMVREIPVLPGPRWLRGWDFGHVCPFVLYAQLDLHGRLLIHAETCLVGGNLYTQIDAAQATTLEYVGPTHPVWDAGDPAAEQEHELGQVKNELLKRGIVLNTIRSRKSAGLLALQERFLRRIMVDGQQSPAFLIHPRCKILIRALSGAYHVSPAVTGARAGKPVETHPWKDAVDTLQYLNDNLAGAQDDIMGQMRKMAAIDRAW